MENAKIIYKIKFHTGKLKNKIIDFTTTVEELEEDGLVSLLIHDDLLASWSNNNEFTVISRDILFDFIIEQDEPDFNDGNPRFENDLDYIQTGI